MPHVVKRLVDRRIKFGIGGVVLSMRSNKRREASSLAAPVGEKASVAKALDASHDRRTTEVVP
jgi:hypothetical protein